jgi:Zn2+/Cd2+-exporting ATPase
LVWFGLTLYSPTRVPITDEAMLTGESAAVVRSPGDSVRAGTLNAGASAVVVRATAAAGDAFVAQMAALVEHATSQRGPSETLVSRFAMIYTPIVVLACVCLAFVPWIFGVSDRGRWVYLALQVLVTACPCALVLSTPVTVVSALARAAAAGALVKGGAHLEALGDVEVATLDKTGTLTLGSFRLAHLVVPSDGLGEQEVLRLVAALESGSSHPMAAALVGRAAAAGARCDAVLVSSELVPGAGVAGVVEGRTVCAGTIELLASRGVDCYAALRVATAWALEGLTTCHFAVDGKYAGSAGARDVLRPEAAEAVAALRALGIRPAILTGDNAAVARAVARAAGVDSCDVHAGMLPQDKLDLVAKYKDGCIEGQSSLRHRRGLLCGRARRFIVAHVGDGVNDAPALAAADLGIAMGVAGAAAALEAGDISLFTDDLRVLPALVRLARAAKRRIWENILLSVITKASNTESSSLCAAFSLDVSILLVIFNVESMSIYRPFPPAYPTPCRRWY